MSSRISRHTPLTGVAFFALLAVGFALTWNSPDSSASAGKVISYYRDHQHQERVGSYLVGLSIFFGLFFVGKLCGYLRQREGRLATVAFGGFLLFAAAGGIAAGTGWALADRPHQLTPGAAQALNLASNGLIALTFAAGLGVFLFAAGLAILRSGLLPRALGWLALVFGVVGLTPLGWFSIFALGVIVLILVPLLYQRDVEPAREGTSTSESYAMV